VREAEARERAGLADRAAVVEIQKAEARAEMERWNAAEVVRQEIEKKKAEILAAADAEQARLRAAGEADAILAKYKAEAEGIQKVLEGKAKGYEALVQSCQGDTQAASTLLRIEKIEAMVKVQTEAIRNLKIDKITVWDSAGGDGGSSTANFASNLIKALPPLHEVAKMAGVKLPEYLGDASKASSEKVATSDPAGAPPAVSPASPSAQA
jgi:flotillin